MTTDNKCEACDGTGSEFSGVEYMGQREVVGCDECCGTGFADVSEGVESLRVELATTRQERDALQQFIQERRTHYAQMQGANKGHMFDWFMGKKDFADELLVEIERLKGP